MEAIVPGFGILLVMIWQLNDGFLFNFTKNKKFENRNLRIHQGCSDHGPYIYNKFYFDKTMKKCYIYTTDFSQNTGNNDIEEVEIYQILN